MYYDINDGIPPYDLPFEGTPYEGGSENSGVPNSTGDNFDYDFLNNQPSSPAQKETSEEKAPENPKPNKNSTKMILPIIILALVLLLGGVLYVMYGADMSFSGLKAKNSNTEDTVGLSSGNENSEEIDRILSEASETISISRNNPEQILSSDDEEIIQVERNKGVNANDDLLASAQNNNEKIATLQTSVPRGNMGRLDPFNPMGGSKNNLFDVLMPPSNPTPDLEAQQLMTLKISGIMYTPDSPSALINIAGSDQLVRRGDKFNGFSVEGISKDKVTVRNGRNTYTASVGESLNFESVGVNAIPNLNNKFAGPYSKGKGRIIEINTIN